MTRRGKSAKSAKWAAAQHRDPYSRRARASGMRARSAYKLEEIDRKYKLISPGACVIDLGAAPGSWSQYAAARAHKVIAVDLAAMAAIKNVRIIRGDFTDAAVQAQIMDALGGDAADLVLSDLAPNLSGIRDADQARAESLQRAVLAFCRRGLRRGGALLTKVFAGESAAAIRAQVQADFKQARSLKPDASRAQSKEFYLLARQYSPAA